MKQQETNRLQKIVEGLEKVKELIATEKVAKASKAIDSLVDKLQKKLSGSESSSAKRAPSAWNLFYKANRSRVVKENPNLETKEIMKMIAKMWKEQEGKISSSPKKASPKAKATKKAKVSPKKKSPTKKTKASPKPRKPRAPKV